MNVQMDCVINGINLKPCKGAFGYATVTLLKDGNDYILFDTGGYGVRKVIYELQKQYPINKVFLSHLHFDHCSNVDLFKNAIIYVNAYEVENLISNQDDMDLYQPVFEHIKRLNATLFEHEFYISDNIKVVFTYGHTKGHSSLEFLENGNKILIAGDSIKSLVDYLNENEYGNAQDYKQFLETKKIIKGKYDIIVPGHSGMLYRERLDCKNIELKIF